MSVMTPKEIVKELDNHIVGQKNAKRAVAIALRNRYRRMKVDESLRNEITPKNILMIGPTGVGKTEIARRLSKLANAPFLKVEATKFTEVGYVGRDVESIIRELADRSYKLTREEEIQKVQTRAETNAIERILDVLVPHPEAGFLGQPKPKEEDSKARALFRDKLNNREIEEQEIELEVAQSNIGVEIMAPPGMEEMTNQLQSMFQNISGAKTKKKKMRIKDAKKILQEEEAAKLVNDDEIRAKACDRAEQHGIVFIDEIDKVTQRGEANGPGVSREGVQRDLLPLVEGCTVSTKYGVIRTDHILFIASGAFHLSKPSDLIPELQGRLPIRVELNALNAEDFEKILTEPNASLTEQYSALLGTEGVTVRFSDSGIKRIAEIAFEVNERTENIGARRLHTVVERLLENISFEANDLSGQTIEIDAEYVDKQLNDLVEDQDLSRFIL